MATHLIYTALVGKPPAPIGQERCGICGSEGAAPFEFSSKFMNADLVRGSALCEACRFCMCEPALRHNSFCATPTGLRFLRRHELAEVLFCPPEPPFVFCVTRTYKKHNAIRARVNLSRERYHVRMEDMEPQVQPALHKPVYEAMSQLYRAGLSKQELATGQVSHRRLKKLSLDAWLELAPALEPVQGTQEMELLLHILTKEEKNGTT